MRPYYLFRIDYEAWDFHRDTTAQHLQLQHDIDEAQPLFVLANSDFDDILYRVFTCLIEDIGYTSMAGYKLFQVNISKLDRGVRLNLANVRPITYDSPADPRFGITLCRGEQFFRAANRDAITLLKSTASIAPPIEDIYSALEEACRLTRYPQIQEEFIVENVPAGDMVFFGRHYLRSEPWPRHVVQIYRGSTAWTEIKLDNIRWTISSRPYEAEVTTMYGEEVNHGLGQLVFAYPVSATIDGWPDQQKIELQGNVMQVLNAIHKFYLKKKGNSAKKYSFEGIRRSSLDPKKWHIILRALIS